MKVSLLVLFLLSAYQTCFSQNEKQIIGQVSSDHTFIEKVEVVNLNSKKITATNSKGEFTILAKANDSLYFICKNYYLKRIKLNQDLLNQDNIWVEIFKKPEELDEIIITKAPTIHWKTDEKWEREKNYEIALERGAKSLKVPGVYTGNIENGANLNLIADLFKSIFVKEKEPAKKTLPPKKFKELASLNCDQKFYLQTLKLKPDEIYLFLEFCDADPRSKTLIENSNVLSMMDFLSAKNIEFKKL
jgi:hypothetical protein